MSLATASYFEPSSQEQAALPLPKINVPPAALYSMSLAQKVAQQHDRITEPHHTQSEGTVKVSTYDIKFTLAVIALVITVNLALAWLLGMASTSQSPAESNMSSEVIPHAASTVRKSDSSREVYRIDPKALQESTFSSSAPARLPKMPQGVLTGDTEVYVSQQDRRVLIKQLLDAERTDKSY